MRFEVRPCYAADIIILAATLRTEEAREFEGLGRVPASRRVAKHSLFALYRRTASPMAAFVDGEIAACWGDEAQALDDTGRMWIVTTPALRRAKLAFFRQARIEIAKLLEHRTRLICDVEVSYQPAIRFWRLLGCDLR